MSPVSNVQFSRFTESEVGKLFTFGGKGALEVVWPASDDERRDLEAHLKEVFGVSLAIQVKARHVLVRRSRASQLWIRFDEKKERLVSHPFFWYFFGYMDLATMAFQAPIFLVPSAVVHAHADPRTHADRVRFTFAASMDPRSHDQWRPYACQPAEAADRVIRVLRAHSRRGRLQAVPRRITAPDASDVLWVGRPAA